MMACGASRGHGMGGGGGGEGGWQGMGLMAVPFPEHARDVLASLDELRRAARLCDTQVNVSGQLFPAHRAVLAASSGYFRKLFENEDRHGVVRLDFVEAEAFSRLLEFAYTATLTVDPARITSLLEATHLLEFGQVASVCSDLLGASIELGNGASDVAVPRREDDDDGEDTDDAPPAARPREEWLTSHAVERAGERALHDDRPLDARAAPPPSTGPHARESEATVQKDCVRGTMLSQQRTKKSRGKTKLAAGGADASMDGGVRDNGEDLALDLSSRPGDKKRQARKPKPALIPSSQDLLSPAILLQKSGDAMDDAAGAILETGLQMSWGYGPEGSYDAPRAPKVCQPCPICNKMIRGAGKLPRHIRTHTGERPYPCHLCGVRFTRQDKLKLHLQKHERLGSCRAGRVKPTHYGTL
ncbi:unnamed protein product [Lampetra fluviatilis]